MNKDKENNIKPVDSSNMKEVDRILNGNIKKIVAISASVVISIFIFIFNIVMIHDNYYKFMRYKYVGNSSSSNKNYNNQSDDTDLNSNSVHSIPVYSRVTADGNILCGVYSTYNCTNLEFYLSVNSYDAKVLSAAGERFVLYKDEDIYLYDKNTSSSKKIQISNDYYSYNLIINDYMDKVLGVSYIEKENEKTSFYNIDNNTIMYNKLYDELKSVSGDYIAGINSTDKSKATHYLLSSKNEKEPYITYQGYYDMNFAIYPAEKYNFIALRSSSGAVLYTYDYKPIYNDILSYKYFYLDKTLLLYANNRFVEYDALGKEIEVIEDYTGTSNSVGFFSNKDPKKYYIIFEDGAVYLKEYKGEKYKLENITNGYIISFSYMSDASSNSKVTHGEGYYITIKTGYDDVNKHYGYEYYFDPKTKKIESWEFKGMEGYEKPILYLYPKKEMQITVNFEHEELLTTTYPKFNNEWKVMAKPNGDLYDKNGKYYYGLYWEEDTNHYVDFSTGFYVNGDNAIDFLEEKLSYIGLNDKERNEFIMYWLPVLEKNEHNLVYFELTEERESYNKLIISPKPDSMLRLAIHVKKVNSKYDIAPQQLTQFNRTGFTAVEWGGINYK